MRTRFRAVVEEFVKQIQNGDLAPGERLPTHRDLAYTHSLSLGTASRVYAELDALGLTVGEVGRGTFVRSGSALKHSEYSLSTVSTSVIDLSRSYLVLPEQEQHFKAAVQQAVENDGGSLLHYQENEGSQTQREFASNWLSDGKLASEITPRNTLICSGGQHALMTSLMCTCPAGGVLVVDEITYPGVLILAEILRIEVVTVPSDDFGMSAERLSAVCDEYDVKAIYVMPNLQNPTSITMSQTRREEIAYIAKARNIFVVEDDAFGFLLDTPAVKLIDIAPENAVYFHTMSKSWAPGLRICMLAMPHKLVEKARRFLAASIWMPSPLMLAVARQLIESGQYAQCVQAKKRELLKRQKIAEKALKGLETITDKRSMHIWLELPANMRADLLTLKLAKQQIWVTPGTQFQPEDAKSTASNSLRLCIGAPRSRHHLSDSLNTICTEILT